MGILVLNLSCLILHYRIIKEDAVGAEERKALEALASEIPDVHLRRPTEITAEGLQCEPREAELFNGEWAQWTDQRSKGGWTDALPLISTEMYFYRSVLWSSDIHSTALFFVPLPISSLSLICNVCVICMLHAHASVEIPALRRRILDCTGFFSAGPNRLADPYESQKAESLVSALGCSAFLSTVAQLITADRGQSGEHVAALLRKFVLAGVMLPLGENGGDSPSPRIVCCVSLSCRPLGKSGRPRPCSQRHREHRRRADYLARRLPGQPPTGVRGSDALHIPKNSSQW